MKKQESSRAAVTFAERRAFVSTLKKITDGLNQTEDAQRTDWWSKHDLWVQAFTMNCLDWTNHWKLPEHSAAMPSLLENIARIYSSHFLMWRCFGTKSCEPKPLATRLAELSIGGFHLRVWCEHGMKSRLCGTLMLKEKSQIVSLPVSILKVDCYLETCTFRTYRIRLAWATMRSQLRKWQK